MSEKLQTTNLSAFWRVLSYVWPQWPRLIALLFWSAAISAMFSASILTIIPILKVMMEEEGLHPWVDRKICASRYGFEVYIPSLSDLSADSGEPMQYLLVHKVRKHSWSKAIGLKPSDQIIAVVQADVPADIDSPSYSRLLQQLAEAPAGVALTVSIRRIDAQGLPYTLTARSPAPPEPFYTPMVRKVLSVVPREKSRQMLLPSMTLVIVGLIILTIVRCLARFYQAYLAEKITTIANANLRQEVFEHVMYMPVGFFSAHGASDTISRITSDVAISGRGIKILFGKTLREPMIAIGALAAAFVVNWKLTLLFLASAPLVLWVIAVLGKKMKKATKKSLVRGAEMLGRLQQAIHGLRIVKVYNRQAWESEQYQLQNRQLVKYHLKMSKIDAMTSPLMDALGMITGGAVILLGTAWVAYQYDNMQASSFFALLASLGIAAESVRKVSDVWNTVQQANAAAERVFAVLDQPVEQQAPDAFDLPPLARQIEFREVSFSYPASDVRALDGINLTVPAGQTIAIVGANGSGKTTLVHLLPRFYEPDSGQILIDGKDIRYATLASLRRQIGLVTQQTFTFHDTIANNIAYSKPGATMDEIIDAAKRAYAHDFIQSLPNGYQTMIGEQNSGFSGGQLQRIVIARAILHNPRILIFDEATSQIDADSEAKIHQALADLMKGRTCFVIAHRFSTVISAERIIVMEDGRIVDDGTHKQLIERCAVYRRLYETQLIGG